MVKKIESISINKPKVVSLFSGAGGMDLGFINAGFEIVWANDFDMNACETYKKNIGNHIVHGDITKISSYEIPNNIDVVIGGFPCQGFSVANTKRSIKDERNFLYKELLRVVKDKQPKFFVGENVKGILSLAGGKVFEMIKEDFKNLGYKIEAKLLNAADYGVPQARQRVVILGNRIEKDIIFPKSTHNEYNYISTKDVISHLSNIETVERNTNQTILINNKEIHNHISYTNVMNTFYKRKDGVTQEEICDYLKYWRNKKGISTKKVDEYFGYKHTAGHWFRKDNKSGSIPKPSDWIKLKKLLGFCNKYDDFVTNLIEKEIVFEQSLRVVNWDKPSDTITASTPEIHINKQRRLSVRECAIIQTFPDDFIFYGSLSSQHRQVGNAVPPLLAEKIANIIKKDLL
ncbi:DNA (cytosine-5-)-methyltransferase [Arcobacter sp. FW59]|nr:DNA (cytosine-5-)-methyltransferase [Arcobacter sp. FW59]